MVDQFQYQRLDDSRNEIRLVQFQQKPTEPETIICEIHHASLNDELDYQALSYVWGDTTDICEIHLNGSSFLITANLNAALQRLRQTQESVAFWVDAICIDQRNANERSHQVSKMRTIYQNASNVLIWLGMSENLSNEALELVKNLYLHSRDPDWIRKKVENQNSISSFYALCALFDREYWKRVWVIQEVTVARHIMVYCGSDTVEWPVLANVQSMLASTYDAQLAKIFGKQPSMRGYITWKGPRALRERFAHGFNQLPNLLDTMLTHSWKKATDPRDKIYALVGLTSARETFLIDYSRPVRQVYIDLVHFVIQTSQKLDVLCALPQGSSSYRLPSWVPDWSATNCYSEDFYSPRDRHRICASGTSLAEVRFAKEDGVLFAKGFGIDSLRALGSQCQMNQMDDFPEAVITFKDWWIVFTSLKGTSVVGHEAFARTLLWNRIGPQHLDNFWNVSKLLRWILGAFTLLSLQFDPSTTLDPALFVTENDLTIEDNHVPPRAMEWISTVSACMYQRRFFVTSSGIIGMAPSSASVGDMVCILLGCSVPVVLRRVEDHYIVIGGAYVDGYMTGEALMNNHLQEFEIH